MKDTKNAAKIYDLFMSAFDFLLVRKWREKLWEKAEGPRVLEAGAGTGLNIGFYKKSWQVTAVDKSRHFLDLARKRAQKEGKVINFISGDINTIPCNDETFDSAAAAFLFCSAQDPLSALKELKRVLKSGGLLLLLEQGPSASFPGSFMNLLARPFYRLAGARLAPDMEKQAKKAGFGDVSLQPVFLDSVKIITARK
ncbi:MAG: class I SAM-dependent methyltransferase [Actinomycetota bacterium]